MLSLKLVKNLIFALFAISLVQAYPIAEDSDVQESEISEEGANAEWRWPKPWPKPKPKPTPTPSPTPEPPKYSEAFGLIAIRSGSDLQYQYAVVSHGELFLSGSTPDPYSFVGQLWRDGSLQLLPDPSRWVQQSSEGSLYLSVDEKTHGFVISEKKDNSFSIKGGHLLYKGKDGVFAVPDIRYGYQNSLKIYSHDKKAQYIVLRTANKDGQPIGDFPN